MGGRERKMKGFSVIICIYSMDVFIFILWFLFFIVSSNTLHITFDYQHDPKSPALCTK